MPPKKTMSGATKTGKAAPKATPPAAPAKKASAPKAAPPKQEKGLVKTQTKAVSTNVADMMADSAGEGGEMFGLADIKRPTIKLMQGLSPYINKNHEKYVQGAENGDILVTGADYLYDGSIELIIIGFAHNYVEWHPRATGGGLIGAHPFNPAVVAGMEKGKGGVYLTEQGTEMHDTMSYFVMYKTPDDEWEPAMLFLKSTMLSVGREINTKLSKRNIETAAGVRKAPVYANIVTLGVVGDSNSEGDWNKFRMDGIEFIDDPDLFMKCKQEYLNFAKSMKIDYAASEEVYTSREGSDEEEEDGGHY